MYYTKDLVLTVVDEEGTKQLYQGWNDYEGRAACDSPDSFVAPEAWTGLFDDIKGGGLTFLVRLREKADNMPTLLNPTDKNVAGTVIGYGSITLAHTSQVARPYLFIRKEYRCKGYGQQLMAALLYITFMECNCRKMSLAVYSFNNHAHRMYQQMGFHEEGYRKEEVYRRGNYWDIVYMGMFKANWKLLRDNLPAVYISSDILPVASSGDDSDALADYEKG